MEEKSIKHEQENKNEKSLNINQMEDNEYYFRISVIRANKWYSMIRNLDYYLTNDFNKVKKRTRKGIPDHLRGYVWQHFAGVENCKYKESYLKMVREKKEKVILEDQSKAEKEILKDLDRTFPDNTFFKDKLGLGQRSLFNVLSMFSKFHIDTGYVQGMGFLAACFLNYMDEESAFCLLNIIMEKYKMKGFYDSGFPELNKAFYKLLCLLKKIYPKLYEGLKSRDVFPSMYASQWFLSFFANLKYDIFTRIIDVILLEGQKVIYKLGLALLKLNEDKILNAKQFDEVMNTMKTFNENINVNVLFEIAFSLKVNSKLLNDFGNQYDALKSSSATDEFLEQL